MVAEALSPIASADPSPASDSIGVPTNAAPSPKVTQQPVPVPPPVSASARPSDADTYVDADDGTTLASPEVSQLGKKPRPSAVSRASSLRKPLPEEQQNRQGALEDSSTSAPTADPSPAQVQPARAADVEKQQAGTSGTDDDGAPRRGVPRRPIEFTLRQQHLAWGAPFPDSGCIVPTKSSWWQMWRIPGPMSLHVREGWYLLVFHIFGAVIISAAANFGIACAMYRKHSDNNVTFWELKHNTIAGDTAVTILIQGTVTYAITSAMVHRDIALGLIGPLRRPWPFLFHLPSTPSPHGCNVLGTRLPSQVPEGTELPMGPLVTSESGWFKRFLLWFVRFLFCGTERNDIFAPRVGLGQRCLRLLWTLAQGLGLSALVVWAPFWGISLCITAPIWTHRQMAHTWVGPAIKCTYGGILALVSNPFFCLMAMGAEPNVKRAYPELDIWAQDELREINALTADPSAPAGKQSSTPASDAE